MSFAKHSGYSRSLRARGLSPFSLSRANIRARSPFLGFRSAENIAFTSPLFAAAAVRARAGSRSRISRIPTASPYVSFRIIRASRALLSSASAAYSRLHLSLSLLRSSSSVSDSLSAARFPCNKRRCPLPAAVSFFSFSSFSPPLLRHRHPPPRPSLSSLWHPCARAHTHTHSVRVAVMRPSHP